MDADDFRDYMLSFLFLRYLSDNYETAAKKELGPDYPDWQELPSSQTPRPREQDAPATFALVCEQPGRCGRV